MNFCFTIWPIFLLVLTQALCTNDYDVEFIDAQLAKIEKMMDQREKNASYDTRAFLEDYCDLTKIIQYEIKEVSSTQEGTCYSTKISYTQTSYKKKSKVQKKASISPFDPPDPKVGLYEEGRELSAFGNPGLFVFYVYVAICTQ